MAAVAFDGVTKRFDDGTVALRQLDLAVEDGEFMVLVGPSGCGKSTALRLLAGLESVSEGTIRIGERVVNDIGAQQRNIAMVFQNYALYPHMSVYNNLAFPLKMLRLPRRQIERKVQEIAQILDLLELLERRPAQLSGGQRQRAAMGRALVRDPSVFLLDEPLSNLDARLRAQIRADIAKIQKRLVKTTVYVTHDQVEAMTLGDRVAVMNNGVIQQVGTPEALYREPANRFVAGFIGSPGMNIVPTILFRAGGVIAARFGEQSIELTGAGGHDADALAPYAGKSLSIGIRPEAFRARGDRSDACMAVRVRAVEYLGHESLLYFGWQGDDEVTCIARVPGRFEPQANGLSHLFVSADDVYVFDEAGVLLRAGLEATPASL